MPYFFCWSQLYVVSGVWSLQGHWPLPPELPGGEGEDPGDPDGEDPGDPLGDVDDDVDDDEYVLSVCSNNEIASGPRSCDKLVDLTQRPGLQITTASKKWPVCGMSCTDTVVGMKRHNSYRPLA